MGSFDMVKLEQLASGSSEYKEVETLMLRTANGIVTRIHKVSATHLGYMCKLHYLKAHFCNI